MNSQNLIENFTEALNAEIAHLKEKNNNPKYTIKNGVKVNSESDNHVYRFETNPQVGVKDDTEVKIKIDEQEFNAVIISVFASKVLVSFSHDIGENIPEAKVIVDPLFLYRIARRKLENISRNEIDFNLDLAMKAFGQKDFITNKVKNIKTDFKEITPQASVRQKEVISKALGSEVSYIWGPPGTGKTTTISFLAHEILERGESLLLTSHTNIAIDNALSSLAKKVKGKDWYQNGEIIRSGAAEKTDLFEKFPKLNPQKTETVFGFFKKKYPAFKRAKVVGTTISRAYLTRKIFNKKFDTVIVDEASMASLPMLFLVSGLAKKRVIIIGDFMQLPPIAQADGKKVDDWLKRDIFEVSGITKKVGEGRSAKGLCVLDEQRRMTKDIAELVNQKVYNGILKTKEKTGRFKEQEEKTINTTPFNGKTLVLCDTSRFNPWCKKDNSGSHFNIYNSLLSAHLASNAGEDVESIALITPFRAQNYFNLKSIKDKVADQKNRAKIFPSSIHQFQGREADLVIVDLVEGPPVKMRWLNDEYSADTIRLINVAITRAKSKLIIIANLDYFFDNLDQDSSLRAVLKEAQKRAYIVQSENIFNYIENNNQEFNFSEINSYDQIMVNQKNFYKLFLTDVRKATEKIIIISPFVTRNRLAKIGPILKNASQKGVKIKVYTKDFEEQKIEEKDGEGIKKAFEDAGIELIQKRRIHEKIAFIDNNIFWMGSLNILSHNNTSESMMRSKGENDKFFKEITSLSGINNKDFKDNNSNNKLKEVSEELGIKCPNGHPMELRTNKKGEPFFGCTHYPECNETRKITRKAIKKIFGKNYLTCKKCNSAMKKVFSKENQSMFLSCRRYPKCKFNRNLKLKK